MLFYLQYDAYSILETPAVIHLFGGLKHTWGRQGDEMIVVCGGRIDW